jgi:UDP-N-acetylmuramoyl-L-alanyl-D-glutamate--2,6-diaminopimelate ligase
MKLGEILSGIRLRHPAPEGLASVDIAGLEYDSRRVREGYLFFAFPGSRADGREFAKARSNGAPSRWRANRRRRRDWKRAGSRWITDGTRWRRRPGFLRQAGRAGGADGHHRHQRENHHRISDRFGAARGGPHHRPGGHHRVSPGGARAAGREHHAGIAGPDPLLAELRAAGGTHATMEVSSHALELGRVYGLQFHTAVFTNLTRDHLDFHVTMEAYFAAKQKLFAGAGGRRRLSPC